MCELGGGWAGGWVGGVIKRALSDGQGVVKI